MCYTKETLDTELLLYTPPPPPIRAFRGHFEHQIMAQLLLNVFYHSYTMPALIIFYVKQSYFYGFQNCVQHIFLNL
jgi:hypothetical protein